jgi:DNA-binding NarL/FixJ family response regulator
MAPRIRVLIVDDHAMVRRGMRDFLDLHPDLEVVGEAADGQAAIEATEQLRPDVIVMDLMMPGMDGIAATAQLKERHASTEIVAITSFIEEDRVAAAIEAGASGFLLKDAGPAELLHAIRVVAAGDALLAPRITRRLIGQFTAQRTAAQAAEDRLAVLTQREREVLALVGQGLSNHEIGTALFLSPATARTHVSHSMAKLGARDRAQLVVIAYQTGLVRP